MLLGVFVAALSDAKVSGMMRAWLFPAASTSHSQKLVRGFPRWGFPLWLLYYVEDQLAKLPSLLLGPTLGAVIGTSVAVSELGTVRVDGVLAVAPGIGRTQSTSPSERTRSLTRSRSFPSGCG